MPFPHSVLPHRIPAALAALLLVLLSLTLLAGCTDGAANQPTQTPVSSSSPSSVASASARSQLPGAVGTSPYVHYPGPASSIVPRADVPAAVATAQARELAENGPTPTPVPTIDPSIPTSTPLPTSTPRPTSTPFPPAPPLTNPVPDPQQAEVQYFPQTGHTLRGVFLDYWNKHGGLSQFGYPITEEFVEADGQDNKPLQVQYFERNRFEQHPENAGTPNEVQLGLLGTETATKKGYFGGSYPRYGHAADFSWIAGQITYHEAPICLHVGCGCSFFTYGESTMKVQLEGNAWRDYELQGILDSTKDTPVGTFLQMFGHMAGPKEQDHRCQILTEIPPVYIVDTFQINALP